MTQVLALKREHCRLSSNDCFALVTTTCQEDAILLTGDRLLRRVASARDVRVHGVLWTIDELHAAEACETELLVSALELWRDDGAVFLPSAEIDARLRPLRREWGSCPESSVRRSLRQRAKRACRLPRACSSAAGAASTLALLAHARRQVLATGLSDVKPRRVRMAVDMFETAISVRKVGFERFLFSGRQHETSLSHDRYRASWSPSP